MSERLDRIESILEVVAKQQRTTAIQQQRNTEDIDTLLDVVSTTDVEVRSLLAELSRTNRRVDDLERAS